MYRYSKTIVQQCEFYKVDNIFKYMFDNYQKGNISHFIKLYNELCTDARRYFIDFLFNEIDPTYWSEIIKTII